MPSYKNVSQFNNSLPVEVEVLKKVDYIRYLLKMGNKEMSTKSYKQLEIGSKYLAQLSHSKDGFIKLSNMKKLPNILQNQLAISVEFEIFKSILSDTNPISFYKESIIEGLLVTQSKDEFLFLTRLLLSLEQNILTIPFIHKKKSSIFQKKIHNSNIFEFYCSFSILGHMSGKVINNMNKLSLELNLEFASSKYILEEVLYQRNFFYDFNINVVEQIKPLYNLDDNLINLES
jgi:hypothetical protein